MSEAMEFHIARAARDRYGIEEPWFGLTGNVVLADFGATRRYAHRINQVRGSETHPDRAVHAGQLHAMGLIDEILHFVGALYRRERHPEARARALARLDRRLGRERVDAALRSFSEEFPPLAVYRGAVALDDYLAGSTGGAPNRELALEELMHLWLANVNPAFEPFRELFDDTPLEDSGYAELMTELSEFFAREPRFGPDDQALVEMLRSPALASPRSLSGQLEYIRKRWGHLLGELLERLIVTLDVVREEERSHSLRHATWSGNASAPVPQFRSAELEREDERFTPDRAWMPHVVMIAKSATVWLDQLARQYARPVHRLDEIPDEELDRLARWGFTALWLIGVWERSPASRRIKQLCGNPDAGASAYSLLDYRIASELGGDEAYERLRDRAWSRGIRLASDMVPNHMGLDSRWVVEHPDWFISLPHSPYPAYRFEGPDLSSDPRVALQIEDHYYDRTDAAVVFKRVDRASGETRYIYHGNDGTLMPWNDTAQLDYLKAEVREGVIQTILHVARHFPIIRFDAAMTLAKRHYQRLWFPEPGGGGAIPSRAEHGLTRAQLDAAMPVEFWREVVDRLAREMPDTLLLAEAFWLMEGYFVRTLGMHRVYNSAFMNMMRDEENANYRSVIKNTLEFDPEILKRYVNFMNNPDERTAIDQFGNGDKYFGVCTLMITLPGLPMFGHGQIEGFTERYGMEFRRAAWEETPDRGLIERHEREIVPLLHRRRLFAEAREFQLYDFYAEGGSVNEDVFAYSNRDGDERTLVLYHNRFAETAGWIRVSAAVAVKTGAGDEKRLVQRTLGEGLGITGGHDRFCTFRDQRGGLEYLRRTSDLHDQGLFVRLDAYRCHVFLDFREVTSDAAHPWATLCDELSGRGVPSLDAALLEIRRRPIVEQFRGLVGAETVRHWIELRRDARAAANDGLLAPPPARAREWMSALVERARQVRLQAPPLPRDPSDLDASAPTMSERLLAAWPLDAANADDEDASRWAIALGWIAIEAAGREHRADAGAARWLHDWRWEPIVEQSLRDLGRHADAERAPSIVAGLLRHAARFRAASAEPDDVHGMIEAWFEDDAVRRAIGVNLHQDTWWFEQEPWEAWLDHLVRIAAIEGARDPALTPRERAARLDACEALAKRLAASGAESGYRVERLLARAVAR